MNKIKKLKQRFKKEAYKQKKSGNGRGKQWIFFTNMDEIIGHRPNVCPEYCINSSVSDKEKTEEQEEGSTFFVW